MNLGPLITASTTGLPAIRDVLNGTTPLLASLGPFLEQLNPILTWLSLHQQLISDFISDGATGMARQDEQPFGGGTGHYLRQFGPVGAETLSFSTNRDSDNRGNTYPPPLWLADPKAFSAGGKYPGQLRAPGLGLQQHRRAGQRLEARQRHADAVHPGHSRHAGSRRRSTT